jgi:hypothetical protein
MRAAIVIAALLAARVAAADPAPAPPGLAPLAQPAHEKSGFVATSLAIAGTALPIGIIYASAKASHSNDRERGVLLGISLFAFTPSLGHWYASRFWTIGMGTRMAGLTLASIGAASLMHDGGDEKGGVIVGCGLLLAAGGVLLDIITASEEADAWNREHATRIKPVAMRLHDGYGIGLAGTF